MTEILSSEPIAPMEIEPGALEVADRSLARRLHTIARTTLAIAGASLVLMGTSESLTPIADAAPAAIKELDDNPSATVPVVATPPENTTIATGIATYNSTTDTPHLYTDAQQIGMTKIRETVSRERAQSDIAVVRHDAVEASAHGETLEVDLVQGPKTKLAGFPKFAATTAKELPMVDDFIILNEEADKKFFNHPHPVKATVDVTYKADRAIHAVRPDATVSGFGIASGYGPLKFLEAANKYATAKYGGLQNIMDRLSVHLYRRPLADEALILQDLKIWPYGIDIDEFGSIVRNSGQPDPLSPAYVTRSQQAQYNLAFMTWAQLVPQIGDILNYRMQNSTDPLDLKTGLITVSGEKLPAYHAVGNFMTGGLDPEATSSSLLPYSAPATNELAPSGLIIPSGLNKMGRAVLNRMIQFQQNSSAHSNSFTAQAK